MERAKRILIVDDERQNRDLLSAMVRSFGYAAETASDGEEALAKALLDIDVVLLDVMLPRMDGFEVVRRMRERPEIADLPVLMVTALDSREDRLRAVEAGANDFIAKPLDLAELQIRLRSQLRFKEARDALERHREELEGTVSRRTQELRRALDEMAAARRRTYEAHLDTIERLVLAAEHKDQDTAAHIKRIGRYCALLAEALDLPASEVELLTHASKLHDVGKIGIPDAILTKPGKFTAEERRIMERHTEIGARILAGSASEVLQAGEVVALTHHERWDGRGYPRRLCGEDIPLPGRICAVADFFDALTTDRPYRTAVPMDDTLELMGRERGKHFDPRLLDIFLERRDDVGEILRAHRDGGHPAWELA